ncbi:thiamine ABC transporter substrate-binding protein [Cryptosporangium arvum]|uniref:ABC transporter periplasmic binding protein, thiB subfamily n=1 Tax=Cryptosporangium arvum DSM 44712 TaxID=927661 RepID=A0A010YFT4_9ACTN|nr:thiamine ABC transporter substrate-binding protein [Cryptosporangium arvum]EXG79090.1 ABC transporter periplasmic binding protein, thiB subfamily [Cryptosporangium arvum DSM 44712]
MRAPRLLAAVLLTAAVAACSSSSDKAATDSKTVTLVTHESFAVSDEVLAAFQKQSGLTVKILRSGDAGAVVNKAVLSKGNPQGDVLFGVDNTFLSRAVGAGVFAPYEPAGVGNVPTALQQGTDGKASAVDYGDVCVNYDKAWFTKKGVQPPASYADLIKPEYKNLLVVENPATSSPGLAFVLGSIAVQGESGWKSYWEKLKANGALVVDGWEEAYQQRFTVGSQGKGDRPLVVSYASSPPAEVVYAEKKPKDAPSGVVTDTCFRQVEYAGLLDGAANPTGGKKLLDFLLSPAFQKDVPLQMFVWPSVTGTPLPAEFTKYAALPTKPLTLPADQITKNREPWIDEWTQTVLR